jgi:TonB-dependent starch-binding outer membrane protein SusC
MMKMKQSFLGKVCLLALFVIFTSAQLYAQKVTGVVVDETNTPLPGVNVVVKGTTNGAITDSDGKFSITPSNIQKDVLSFSFIGMDPNEVSINGQKVINVQLKSNTLQIDEVVAVGYGTVKKRDVTGSVASIKGEQLAAIPVSNVAQALGGRLAGVSVVSQDGRPDASISIRVRGGGSISQSNDPLLIVDGFPVSSIADIPANQIENIDALKDASSTAIYGARGANGVIIITTKKGKSGKLTITYDGFGKFNTPTKYLPTMNAYDYLAYNWGYAKAISDTYSNAWESLWAIGSKAATYNNTEGIDHYKNVTARDYSKEIYNESFSQSHNINISGGTERTKFLISLNAIDEDGMKVNSWYKRYNAALKLDQKLSNNLNLSLDLRYTNVDKVSNESTTNAKGSILSTAYQFRPIATADVLGELDDSKNTALGLYDTVLQDAYNPVARTMDYTPETRERKLVANTGLNWDIIKGLTARTELGLTTYWNKTNTWSGAVYNNYFDALGNKTYGGDANIEAKEGWSMRWANTLSYQVQGLGEDHSLNLMAGQEVSDSGSEKVYIWGKYYPASFDANRAFAMMDQYRSSSGSTNYFGYSSNTEVPSRMLSFFGRANYSLKNKYLLTATFRADGSSRFAPTNRWGYFPAAALAWRIKEESFLKDVSWLDNLKLRLSYGSVGNDGISANLWRQNWKSDGLTNYSINESKQVAYSPASTTIANENLRWETTVTRNLGVDYGFFNNRVYGSIDTYWNTTKDLLMLTSIPPISGFTATYDNIGSTSNKGIEFSIGGDIVRSKDFNLSANFNITFNKGKVEELADGVNGLYKTQWGSSMTQPNTGDYILKEGQPVGLVRGYQYDGWYTTSDFNYANGVYTLKSDVADIGSGIIGTVYGTTGKKPGSQVAYPGVVKFKDISGPNGVPDGIVNESDVDVIGDMNPIHTGGFNIQGNYKSLDFMLGFNWSYGNKIYNANYLAAFYGSKEDGLFRNRLNYLSSSYKIYDIQNGQLVSVTDPAALDALNANATTFLPYHENPVVSTMGIQDGSFLRLNNVTLGYSLPKNLTKKVGISKIRFYGTIYNALTLTNYKGLDPEVNTNTNQGDAQYPTTGLDWGSYPRARSYTVGINVEF